ncbi:AraC family transcriptional regulator [Limosilactobacillus panis]|uniref:AraC family transcriptional regulator n=1 Tax=Limosilactobacillus panis TaxID=47493 RepID=UPI001C94E903|nr:AraC family transcriptional regulator [Limosilactobacillus panis]QZN92976.1 AraC family transcriptional regulator [Limosilactobacillus panis]
MNLLRQYLRTTSFAYSIIRNGQTIEKDRDNLLAGTFNAKKFALTSRQRRLVTFYKLKGQNIITAIIRHHNYYYVIGPVIISTNDQDKTPQPFLVSSAHLKHFSADRFIMVIALCINLLGAYINSKKLQLRYRRPVYTNTSFKKSSFIRLNNNGAHVNYAFEKQINNAILCSDQAEIHTALTRLYQSGRIGILSNKGELRNIIDFGIIVISTNIRVALRSGMNFELAYSLNDYYVHRLEEQKSFHAVIKCIEDNLTDLSKEVKHDITAGMPPTIVRAYRIVSTNPQEDITIVEVAKQLNISPNYFSSQFKKWMGISFTQFRILEKINCAITLLVSSNMNVSEIAALLHFNDQAYFANQFKKHTGFSPNQVRNNPILISDWNIYNYLKGKCRL